jgi:3-hydroxyacyl-CoA dehydrogenase
MSWLPLFFAQLMTLVGDTTSGNMVISHHLICFGRHRQSPVPHLREAEFGAGWLGKKAYKGVYTYEQPQ